MTNDPDNHAEDSTGRRAEHRAGEASDSHSTADVLHEQAIYAQRHNRHEDAEHVRNRRCGCHRARHPGRLADGAAYPIATPAPRRVRHRM